MRVIKIGTMVEHVRDDAGVRQGEVFAVSEDGESVRVAWGPLLKHGFTQVSPQLLSDGREGWSAACVLRVVTPGATATKLFRDKARGARWATRAAVTREMRRGGASAEAIARWHAWAREAACPARDRFDALTRQG